MLSVWEQSICSQIIGGIMINNSHRNLEKPKFKTPVSMTSKANIIGFDTSQYTGRYSGECTYLYWDSKNVKYFHKPYFYGETVICLTLPTLYHSLDKTVAEEKALMYFSCL